MRSLSQLLSCAKTMVNVSCDGEGRQQLSLWPDLFATWVVFARHGSEEVRARAATVASQLLRDTTTKNCIMVRSACCGVVRGAATPA